MSAQLGDDLWFVEVTALVPSSRVQGVAAEASARLRLPTEKLLALLDNRVGPVTKPLPRASAERVADVLDAAGAEVAVRQAGEAIAARGASKTTTGPAAPPPATRDARTSSLVTREGEGTVEGSTDPARERAAAEPVAGAPSRDGEPAANPEVATEDGTSPATWKPPLLPRQPSPATSSTTQAEDHASAGERSHDEGMVGHVDRGVTVNDAQGNTAEPNEAMANDGLANASPVDPPSKHTSVGATHPPSNHDDPWSRMADFDDDEDFGGWAAPTRPSGVAPPAKAGPAVDPFTVSYADEDGTSLRGARQDAHAVEAEHDRVDVASPSTPQEHGAASQTSSSTHRRSAEEVERDDAAGWYRGESEDVAEVPDADDLWGSGARDPFAEAERRERFVRRLVLGTALLIAAGVLALLQFG